MQSMAQRSIFGCVYGSRVWRGGECAGTWQEEQKQKRGQEGEPVVAA